MREVSSDSLEGFLLPGELSEEEDLPIMQELSEGENPDSRQELSEGEDLSVMQELSEGEDLDSRQEGEERPLSERSQSRVRFLPQEPDERPIREPESVVPFARLVTPVFRARNHQGELHSLYLGMAPGKAGGKNGRRDLGQDLAEIRQKGVRAIFCLQEWAEMWRGGLVDYPRLAQEAGFRFYHLQVRDGGVPSGNDMRAFLRHVNYELARGDVLVHCRCGLGRAGTLAACFLILYGEEWKTALAKVRALREGAVQTREQEKFIRKFKK